MGTASERYISKGICILDRPQRSNNSVSCRKRHKAGPMAANQKKVPFAAQIGIGAVMAWGALILAQWAGCRGRRRERRPVIAEYFFVLIKIA